MPPYESTKTLLAKHGLSPAKSRGQNFLVNRKMAERIVAIAGFSPEDKIIEVGVGLGALTLPLANAVASVYGIEVDSGIIRYHQKEDSLPGNVALHHGDILHYDFALFTDQFPGPLKIIANLPYSISNPFLFKLIENRKRIDQVVVMLQKEVADRLTAVPRTKEYGIPTVLLSSCASVTKLMRVDGAEFHPRPKIDSQVIRISFHKDQPELCSFPALQKVVRASFQNRRKMLLNNLSRAAWLDPIKKKEKTILKQELSRAIHMAGLMPEMRAEAISVSGFQNLTSCLENLDIIR